MMGTNSGGDEAAGRQRRILIRFAVELFQAGLFFDDDCFPQVLRNILGKGKGSEVILNLCILMS